MPCLAAPRAGPATTGRPPRRPPPAQRSWQRCGRRWLGSRRARCLRRSAGLCRWAVGVLAIWGAVWMGAAGYARVVAGKPAACCPCWRDSEFAWRLAGALGQLHAACQCPAGRRWLTACGRATRCVQGTAARRYWSCPGTADLRVRGKHYLAGQQRVWRSPMRRGRGHGRQAARRALSREGLASLCALHTRRFLCCLQLPACRVPRALHPLPPPRRLQTARRSPPPCPCLTCTLPSWWRWMSPCGTWHASCLPSSERRARCPASEGPRRRGRALALAARGIAVASAPGPANPAVPPLPTLSKACVPGLWCRSCHPPTLAVIPLCLSLPRCLQVLRRPLHVHPAAHGAGQPAHQVGSERAAGRGQACWP